MPLSKFKKNKMFSAVRKFTNRKQPTELFDNSLLDLLKGRKLLNVIVFYGIGGIGKTRLLSHLKDSLKSQLSNRSQRDIKIISISLDAYEFDSPTDILLNIRNQLSVPAILFDYALMAYWASVGNTPIEIKKKFIKENSFVWEIVESAKSLVDVSVTAKLVGKSLEIMSSKYVQYFSKYREEIKEVQNLETIEIYQRLPFYLGLSIYEGYEQKGMKHVVFLDSYETMLKKFEGKVSTEGPDDWLRELIASSERGLFIIGSREYIKWTNIDQQWDEYLDQHILGALTENDAEFFLKSVPINNDAVRKSIIKTAKGLPLYLDLCVGIYEAKISKGSKITPKDFEMAETEVINRFLRHLIVEERELVKILSSINFFNYDLFKHLITEFNIGYPVTLFDNLTAKSFISQIDEHYKLFKIHDTMREHIEAQTLSNLKKSVIGNVLSFISSNKTLYTLVLISKYFGHLVHLICNHESLDRKDIESFLDIGFFLIDNGFWLEVGQIVDNKLTSSLPENILALHSLRLLKGVFLRRIGKLEDALEEFEKIKVEESKLGRFYILGLFHKTNVIRLLGNYDEAQILYEALTKKVEVLDPTNQFYVKINRQFADLLFLRGRFKQALEILIPLITQTSGKDELEFAECLRIIGHIHRFNMKLDIAENRYNEALSIAKKLDAKGLAGKIYTNLTETNCWINADKAMKFGETAVEMNEALGSKIEIGKTLAAISIANILKGDHENAKSYMQRSKELQSQVGYLSGVLFAEIAELLILISKGNRKLVSEKQENIESRVAKLKVYEFLKLPLYLFMRDKNKLMMLQKNIEWLDYKSTSKFIRNFVKVIRQPNN